MTSNHDVDRVKPSGHYLGGSVRNPLIIDRARTTLHYSQLKRYRRKHRDSSNIRDSKTRSKSFNRSNVSRASRDNHRSSRKERSTKVRDSKTRSESPENYVLSRTYGGKQEHFSRRSNASKVEHVSPDGSVYGSRVSDASDGHEFVCEKCNKLKTSTHHQSQASTLAWVKTGDRSRRGRHGGNSSSVTGSKISDKSLNDSPEKGRSSRKPSSQPVATERKMRRHRHHRPRRNSHSIQWLTEYIYGDNKPDIRKKQEWGRSITNSKNGKVSSHSLGSKKRSKSPPRKSQLNSKVKVGWKESIKSFKMEEFVMETLCRQCRSELTQSQLTPRKSSNTGNSTRMSNSRAESSSAGKSSPRSTASHHSKENSHTNISHNSAKSNSSQKASKKHLCSQCRSHSEFDTKDLFCTICMARVRSEKHNDKTCVDCNDSKRKRRASKVSEASKSSVCSACKTRTTFLCGGCKKTRLNWETPVALSAEISIDEINQTLAN